MDWFLYDRDLRHEESTKLDNKFTESQNQKIWFLARIYGCLKWLGKPLSLINIKFILQIRSINTEAGVSRCSVKMVFLTVSQNSQENIYVGIS